MSLDVIHALNAHTVREEARLDAINEKLEKISAVQVEQHAVLVEHIRRTEAAEGHLEKVGARLRILEDGALSWATAGKISAGIAGALAVVGAVLKAVGVL